MADGETIYRSEAFQTSFDESSGMVRYLTFHRHPDGLGTLALTWKHYSDNGRRTTSVGTDSLGLGYDPTDRGWMPRVGLTGAITEMGVWEGERMSDGDTPADHAQFRNLLGSEFLSAPHFKDPALMEEFARHSTCLATRVTAQRLRLKVTPRPL